MNVKRLSHGILHTQRHWIKLLFNYKLRQRPKNWVKTEFDYKLPMVGYYQKTALET